ncbi:MAG: hypothetical protein WBC07_07260 [Methylotenera sp.]
MSGFTCCFWWFLLGFLLGWLLNWLLKRCCGNKNVQHTHTAPPVNKVAAAPAAPVAPKPVEPKVIPFDLAAAKAAGFAIRKADDLTVVEGIGPKINELLINDGIKTFAQLAATAVPVIQAILDKAGPRFALAKPGTWPQQAGLAAENRWVELKKLQDELKGGV